MTTFLAADDEGDALGGIRGGGGCCAGTGGLMHRGTLALPFGTMSTIIHVIVILVLKHFKRGNYFPKTYSRKGWIPA